MAQAGPMASVTGSSGGWMKEAIAKVQEAMPRRDFAGGGEMASGLAQKADQARNTLQEMNTKLSSALQESDIGKSAKKFIEDMNRMMDPSNRGLKFIPHDHGGQMIAQVIDKVTGKVIAQIPPQEVGGFAGSPAEKPRGVRRPQGMTA